MNGKGDSPRSCFSRRFKQNFDNINWNKLRTIDDVCGNVKGTFKHQLKESEEDCKLQQNVIRQRIKKLKNK